MHVVVLTGPLSLVNHKCHYHSNATPGNITRDGDVYNHWKIATTNSTGTTITKGTEITIFYGESYNGLSCDKCQIKPPADSKKRKR